MSDIEWVDEPPPAVGNWNGLRRDRAQKFAAELRANPGHWALYPCGGSKEAARAQAYRISHGRNSSFGKGFKAISQQGAVYVIYEGEK